MNNPPKKLYIINMNNQKKIDSEKYIKEVINMTTTNNKVETNDGCYTEAEAKVFEIMEYLMDNVKDSYPKSDYNWGSFELTTTMKNDRINFLFRKDDMEYITRTSDEKWTLVELFIRQYLNNGMDGFGMFNVEVCFDYIMDNIDFIIEQDMISETGYSNSGSELWRNHRPEYPRIDIYFNEEVEID